MESLLGSAMLVFLMICVVSTVYAIFVSSPYKRDENADFGEMDIETVKKLLKEKLEYPYCKSISTNEASEIDFVCKYTTYSVKIDDRKLSIDYKFRPFAKASDIEEEKDCLEAHLVKLLLPEIGANPDKALGHFRRYMKARILGRVSGWLFLMLLILYTLNINGIHITDVVDIWMSKGVSQMCLTEYSEEVTIGEALRAVCPAGKWSSDKIDKGLYRVAFSGYGMNGSLLTIVFQSMDWRRCSIQSIAIDGQDCTLFGGMILEILFANSYDGNFGEPGYSEWMNEDMLALDEIEPMSEAETRRFEQQDENVSFSDQTNGDIDYVEAYSSIVEETWYSYDEYCEYTLYDLDGDGIKELITSEGTSEADWTNVVYTLEDGYVSMIGQFYGSAMLYVAEDGNGLYAVSGGRDYQNIDQITKSGNRLYVETIMNGEIGVEEDYYSNNYPVNFTSVADDSLLRQ